MFPYSISHLNKSYFLPISLLIGYVLTEIFFLWHLNTYLSTQFLVFFFYFLEQRNCTSRISPLESPRGTFPLSSRLCGLLYSQTGAGGRMLHLLYSDHWVVAESLLELQMAGGVESAVPHTFPV